VAASGVELMAVASPAAADDTAVITACVLHLALALLHVIPPHHQVELLQCSAVHSAADAKCSVVRQLSPCSQHPAPLPLLLPGHLLPA